MRVTNLGTRGRENNGAISPAVPANTVIEYPKSVAEDTISIIVLRGSIAIASGIIAFNIAYLALI